MSRDSSELGQGKELGEDSVETLLHVALLHIVAEQGWAERAGWKLWALLNNLYLCH